MAKPHASLPQRTLVIKFYGSARPLWGWETELQIESPLCAVKSPFSIHRRRESCKPRQAQGWQITKSAIFSCTNLYCIYHSTTVTTTTTIILDQAPHLIWNRLCYGVTSNKLHWSRVVLLVTRWHGCPTLYILCSNSRHLTECRLHSVTSLDLTTGQGQHMFTSACYTIWIVLSFKSF